MINFSNVSFVKSAPSVKERPQDLYPEVLIVGKSNVGKSSLINTLCQRKSLAYTSSKPGHTRLLNYYNIDNKILGEGSYGQVCIGTKNGEKFAIKRMKKDKLIDLNISENVAFLKILFYFDIIVDSQVSGFNVL